MTGFLQLFIGGQSRKSRTYTFIKRQDDAQAKEFNTACAENFENTFSM